MLKSISLKFTDSPDLSLPTKGVTIFVGSNNSGKSLVLRELHQALRGDQEYRHKLLGDFEIDWPTDADIKAQIEELTLGPGSTHYRVKRYWTGTITQLDQTSIRKCRNQYEDSWHQRTTRQRQECRK